MNQSEAVSVGVPREVLCVMSEEQYEDYVEELGAMCPPGIELVHQPSADDALDEVQERNPALLIVGMELDSMDGLEFVAMVMNRYTDFPASIVVLPDKGDPFPAVIQSRNAKSGQSSTEETDLPAIGALIRSLAPAAAALAPKV